MGKLAAVGALVESQKRHDQNLLRVATVAANTETVVIGTETYTCVSSGASNFEFVPGADADGSASNLADEINARNAQDLTAVAITGVGVLVYSNRPGIRALSCTETLAGANNEWAAAEMFGGTEPELDNDLSEKLRAQDMVARSPTSTEVAAGQMEFIFGFEPAAAIVDVRDTNGDAKAWDGATSIDGRRVIVDQSGATDLLATDTVTVMASE